MATLTIADLDNGKRDLETVDAVANSRADTTTTRYGDNVLTLAGALRLLGWQAPTPYVSGLPITSSTITVERDGVVYRPDPELVPFTTGAWDPGQWRVLQDSSSSGRMYQFLTLPEAQAAATTLPDGTAIWVAGESVGFVSSDQYHPESAYPNAVVLNTIELSNYTGPSLAALDLSSGRLFEKVTPAPTVDNVNTFSGGWRAIAKPLTEFPVDSAAGTDIQAKIRTALSAARAVGGGRIVFPNRPFEVAADQFSVACSNIDLHFPSQSEMRCLGRVLFDQPPTGLGYGGGYSNFTVSGSGKIVGVGASGCLQFNLIHVSGVTCREGLQFIECADLNHVFDLGGCSRVLIENTRFLGSKPSPAGTYQEFIQIGSAALAGDGWEGGRPPEVQAFFDSIDTTDVTVRNNTCAPYQIGNTVSSYPLRLVGDHGGPGLKTPGRNLTISGNMIDRVRAPGIGDHAIHEKPVFSLYWVDGLRLENNTVIGHGDLSKDRPFAAVWLSTTNAPLTQKINIVIKGNRALECAAASSVFIGVSDEVSNISKPTRIEVSQCNLKNVTGSGTGVVEISASSITSAEVILRENTLDSNQNRSALKVSKNLKTSFEGNTVFNTAIEAPIATSGSPLTGAPIVLTSNSYFNCSSGVNLVGFSAAAIKGDTFVGGMQGLTGNPTDNYLRLPSAAYHMVGVTFVSPTKATAVLLAGEAVASTGWNHSTI